MSVAKPTHLLLAAAVASLFAFALWLRVTSLGSIPDVNGDEVWHAIQLTRMIRGESYHLLTPNDLPLSPIHAALELPGLLATGPSLWVVRLPALITGIAAVILMYILARRMFDQTTALIAALLLASLPVAILFSRVSYESSHAPLYGLLILYYAHRLRIWVVAALLGCSYFVHPTQIFLLPVLVGIIVARSLAEFPEDPDRSRRRMLLRVAAVSGVVLAVGVPTLFRSSTRRLSAHFDTGLGGTHDILDFASKFENLMLGTETSPGPARGWLFWSTLATLFGVGNWRLAAGRRWDRLALVVGTAVATLCLFAAGGSNIIRPGMTRYGLFLVAPMVLSVACLAESIAPAARSPRLVLARYAGLAGVLAIGWAMCLSVDLTRVTMWSNIHPAYHDVVESPWTLGPDAKPTMRALADALIRDLDRGKAGGDASATGAATIRHRVVVEDSWLYHPLEWLTIRRDDVEIFDIDSRSGPADDRPAFLRETLQAGGYVVGFYSDPAMKQSLDAVFLPGELRQWAFRLNNGQPWVTLYRLKPQATAARVAADAVMDRLR